MCTSFRLTSHGLALPGQTLRHKVGVSYRITCGNVRLACSPFGADAVRIGEVVASNPGYVVLRTAMGGNRIVDLLPVDQLLRIC